MYVDVKKTYLILQFSFIIYLSWTHFFAYEMQNSVEPYGVNKNFTMAIRKDFKPYLVITM